MMEKTETGDYLAQNIFHIESDLYKVELSKKELTWTTTVAEGQESTDGVEKLSLLTREILSVELIVREVREKGRSDQVSTGGKKSLQNFSFRKRQPASSGLLIINYARKKNVKSEDWRVKKLKLSHVDFSILEKWFTQLQSILKDFRRPRNILVFINPYGGSRDAPKIFENEVKPVLEISHVSWTLIQTERRAHATDTLLSMSAGELSTYDVTLAVGGDGTCCEIVTGLLKRGREDSKENHLNDSNSNLERLGSSGNLGFGPSPMPIAVVSAGSTNSLAFTLHGTEDATTAAIHLVLGSSVSLDVASIVALSSPNTSSNSSSIRSNGKSSTSDNNSDSDNFRLIVGQMSYGHLADTLKYSEKFRWMGPKRYDYAGFKKFVEHSTYHGRIHMKVAEDNSSTPKPTPTLCETGNGCAFCKNSKKESISSKWVTVEGQFLGISGANMSCRCTISPFGLAPYAHLSDGCLDLMLIKRASHLDHLKYLLRLAGDSRRVMDLPFIERYRVYEFKFEPITCSCSNSSSTGEKDENSSESPTSQRPENSPECSCDASAASRLKRQSGWNCDGELLTNPLIHVKVHQNLIQIMSRVNANSNS